jgi:hypothetical protein
MSKGLTDKLFWREIKCGFTVAHCFKRRQGGGFISLCDRYVRKKSNGQKCWRPPPAWRCPLCDGREMSRRGVEQSMPESPDWEDYWKWK